MFALPLCLSVSSLDVISDLICTRNLQRSDKRYIASSSICVLSDVIKLLVRCSSVPLVDLHGISGRAEYTSLPLPRWRAHGNVLHCVLHRSAVSQTELLCFPSVPVTSMVLFSGPSDLSERYWQWDFGTPECSSWWLEF